MKVAIFGYRSWALEIFSQLPYRHKIVDIGEADVVLYYGWSWMIPPEIYKNKLCFILHTSPLPKYRGGSPLQNQILRGEKVSAATILKVADKIDRGDIYSQSIFLLDGTIQEIFKRIVKVGTIDTIQLLDDLDSGKAKFKKQNNKKATYFKRRKPEESEITLLDLETKPSERLYDFIRALADPYPNAFIKCADGKKLYITDAHLESQEDSKVKP